MAKLYFYYAAMNAGKSTTLLQADFNYRERGMCTMLWTAALDNRAGSGRISSRLEIGADAHAFDPETDLLETVGAELTRRRLRRTAVVAMRPTPAASRTPPIANAPRIVRTIRPAMLSPSAT